MNIVERLRQGVQHYDDRDDAVMQRAADEIDRLRRHVERMAKAESIGTVRAIAQIALAGATDQPSPARVEDGRLRILLDRIAADCQAGLHDTTLLTSNPPQNPCAYHVLQLLREAGYPLRTADNG